MKTKALLSFLFFVLIFFSKPLSAQTSISIMYASDGDSTIGGYCHVPDSVSFYIYGQANGYPAGDSVTVSFNFGDGFDTTMKLMISQNWYYTPVHHVYTAAGSYNVQYMATGSDGHADTLVVLNEVIVNDSCENISGRVYVDINSDCIFNTGDVPKPYVPVELLYSGVTHGWTYTDSQGFYYFNVPVSTNYSVRVANQIGTYGYSVTCPASGQIAISSLPSTGNDFGLNCVAGFDLEAYLWGTGFRPGFLAHIYTMAWNHFCAPVSGQMKLVINDPLLTYATASPAPDQIIGDTLIWNFTNLSNSTFWWWWNNTISTVNIMTSASAVIGDTVCATLIIVPITGDVNPANNIIHACWPVRNSWDPNDKAVFPRGTGVQGYVPPNTEFTYTVRFQNTGTDIAYNIFVLDTLNPNLDIHTFTPIASSHPMESDILPGNVLRFNFPNIDLINSSANEPLSHGWVTYKISAKTGLANGTTITNKAGIYFDFNPPIITNTTLNTIGSGAGIADLQAQSPLNLNVYPNPAKDKLTIETNTDLHNADLRIMNLVGQNVMQLSGLNGNSVVLNTKDLPDGIYFIILKNAGKQLTTKVVIDK